MAVLSRIRALPQQRFDLEDLEALLAALRADSKLFAKQTLSVENLIYKGFTVTGIGLKSATVAMTDATLIIPQNSYDFSWYSAAPSEPNITISDADLTDNARNYVEIELMTENNTPLTKAFWDPEANSGEGAEFNQIVDTITDLAVSMVVSTGGFSGSPNRLPLCIIDTDGSGNIKMILDRRVLFGRLGRPNDIDNRYNWGSRIEPVYTMALSGVTGTFTAGETISIGSETATVVTGGTTNITFNAPSGINFESGDAVVGGSSGATGTIDTVYESFTGADKSLRNQKDINDALMTEIAIMKGTRFWPMSAGASLNGLIQFLESVMVQVTATAAFAWDGSDLSITDDNVTPGNDTLGYIRMLGRSDDFALTREDGTGGTSTIAIADGEILYVKIPTTGSRTFSGSGSGDTNFQVAARGTYASSDENYWIAYREGNRLYIRGYGELEPGEEVNIGDPELEEVLAAIAANQVKANQDRNTKLIEGGLWSYNLATFEISFDEDAYVQVAGLLNVRNTIQPQTIALPNATSVAYVEINRSGVTPNNLTVTVADIDDIVLNDNICIIARRVTDGVIVGLGSMLLKDGESRLLYSGGGAGSVKADFLNPISTTLPAGTSVNIDGVAGANDDLVLFTNLSSNNNRIYKLGGVGTSLTWTPQPLFSTGINPEAGDSVRIKKGNAFTNQLAVFDGTEFTVNDVVRYFDGVSSDFFEQSSLKTLTLDNNDTSEVFRIAFSGSENIIMEYSLLRSSTLKRAGTLYITTNGTDVNVADPATYIGDVGVIFYGEIDGSDLVIYATTTNLGTSATLKYSVRRWSDAAGGPTGIPSYSSDGPSGTVPAAGNLGEVQYHGISGILDANSRFKWNNSDGAIDLNGLQIGILSSAIVLADNQAVAAAAFGYPATWKYAVIEYSVERAGIRRKGRFDIQTDGSVVDITEEYMESAIAGLTFTAVINGANVELRYTSTNTGSSASLKMSFKRWA